MSKKQITQNSIAVLAAFLAVCGINFLYQIRGTSTMLSNSVTAMLMFGAFTYVGAQFLKKAVNARLLVYGAAGGMMFAAFAAWGFSLNYTDTIWNPQVFPAFASLSPFFTTASRYGSFTGSALPYSFYPGFRCFWPPGREFSPMTAAGSWRRWPITHGLPITRYSIQPCCG